jgi:SAM-dependent methyltransferase
MSLLRWWWAWRWRPPVLTPEEEGARYSELYRKGYGHGPVDELYNKAEQWGAFSGIKSILDVGCGMGYATKRFRAKSFTRVVGVDISSYAVDTLKAEGLDVVCADCRRLPDHFRHGEFDLLWSCDMLEHLHPSWVGDALKAIHSVCACRALFNISTRPSRILDAKKRNLHLTVESPDWWRSQIKRAGFSICNEDIQTEDYMFRTFTSICWSIFTSSEG